MDLEPGILEIHANAFNAGDTGASGEDDLSSRRIADGADEHLRAVTQAHDEQAMCASLSDDP
jgi:hypothetical protein